MVLGLTGGVDRGGIFINKKVLGQGDWAEGDLDWVCFGFGIGLIIRVRLVK